MADGGSQYVIDIVLRMQGASQANRNALRMAQRMVRQQQNLRKAYKQAALGIREQERAQRALQARQRSFVSGANRLARTAASGAYGIRGAGHAIDGGYAG